jgi:phage tail sheath protein FI
MQAYEIPRIHIGEATNGLRTIRRAPTSITAFVGRTLSGPINMATRITSFTEFECRFGSFANNCPMSFAVRDFFNHGGTDALIVRVTISAGTDKLDEITTADIIGDRYKHTGIYALEQANSFSFNLLCIPLAKEQCATDEGLYKEATIFCDKQRAMLIADCPQEWDSMNKVLNGVSELSHQLGTGGRSAAFYYPRITNPNPLNNNKVEPFPACGAVAGVIARTDKNSGVWKPPAGIEARLDNCDSLELDLTNRKNDWLNSYGCNGLRSISHYGPVIWGARTLAGNEKVGSEWKYISVRRFAAMIEESISSGASWAAFEPNDATLWTQIRTNIRGFLADLFKDGALAGNTVNDAFFVNCGNDTTTQNEIDRGLINIVIGFAPLKPAEFIVLKIQQRTSERT